jgi:hypothetical protein
MNDRQLRWFLPTHHTLADHDAALVLRDVLVATSSNGLFAICVMSRVEIGLCARLFAIADALNIN